MALPAQLLAVAATQYACMTLDQARAAKVSQDMLDDRVAGGELWSPHRGVYAINGAPRSWRQDLMAACLAGGLGTVASHRAALQLWELVDLDEPPVEISIPRPRSPRFGRGSVIMHRPLDLAPAHAAARHRIPVTNPLRSMVDAAGVLDASAMQEALDAGIARRLFTISAVDAMRARLAKPGKNGPGKLKALLDAQVLTDEVRTVLEARMAPTVEALRAAALRLPAHDSCAGWAVRGPTGLRPGRIQDHHRGRWLGVARDPSGGRRRCPP